MASPEVTLVIEGTYPWYRGGVSEWVAQYLRCFDDFTFNIVQVATDPLLHEDLRTALYDVPAHVKEFMRIKPPAGSRVWGLNPCNWFENYYEALEPVFNNTDLIHIANTGFAGWLGTHFAGELNKPLILTEHALYWKEIEMGASALECGYEVPGSRDERGRMASRFEKLATEIYSGCDEIISVSECNRAYQRKLGAEKVHYIGNGVHKEWFVPDRNRNGSADAPVIGWIGRCAEMKNPMKFFDVVDAIEAEAENTKFLMMICDANEPGLQEKVIRRSDSCEAVELIQNEPTRDHIDKMDAVCITSHNESQPLVMLESLARQVLPVGWATGDVTQKYGWVVPQDTSAAVLGKQLLELWQSPKEWEREVKSRYRFVKEQHQWEAVFSSYRTLFQSYLERTSVLNG